MVNFTWDAPGQAVGPNNSYVTAVNPVAGAPAYVAWAAQLNLTYTPLVTTGNNSGYTYQPAGDAYESDPLVNGTMFVALVSENPYLTPVSTEDMFHMSGSLTFIKFNLSMLNPYVVALGLYQAG